MEQQYPAKIADLWELWCGSVKFSSLIISWRKPRTVNPAPTKLNSTDNGLRHCVFVLIFFKEIDSFFCCFGERKFT
jgi:hypothetical protein